MARTPNYGFERKERDRLKAAKKAEKQAARESKKLSDEAGQSVESPTEPPEK